MLGYGIMPGPRKWLPVKEPDSCLDYTENVQAALTNPYTGVVDPLVSLTLAAKPSGDGELALSRLSVDSTGFLITWWAADGVPGRNYILNLEATTAAGRVFQWVFGQVCDPLFAVGFPTPPPSPGFGAQITWTADGVLATAGGFLTLSSLGAWPTSDDGLLPGALYAAASAAPAFINAVPGFGHVPGPPVMFGDVTASALLALGAVSLPQTDPHVVNQIWVNGAVLCVSLG
jgi:hypothetical protein